MNACICIYLYTHTHTYLYIYTCMYVYVHLSVYNTHSSGAPRKQTSRTNKFESTKQMTKTKTHSTDADDVQGGGGDNKAPPNEEGGRRVTDAAGADLDLDGAGEGGGVGGDVDAEGRGGGVAGEQRYT